MSEEFFIERVNSQKPFCAIKCDGGYYTKYASYAKDKFGRHLEFGDRLVDNPAAHNMPEFSADMAFSDYGKKALQEVEAIGFKNPRFVRLSRAECVVIVKETPWE